MNESPIHVAVFGAGALGLGFLGDELSADCRVTYLDIPAKADLLDHLEREGSYTFNQSGLSMRSVRVDRVNGVQLRDGPERDVAQVLDDADLVFTAVGARNLHGLASVLAAAAGRRGPERPLRVLCGENGVEIAAGLLRAVRERPGPDLTDRLRTGDTVMGRMCQTVTDPKPPVRPAAPGLKWGVVAEPYFGIPVQEHAVEGMPATPVAVRPLPEREFAAAEDSKMLAHNGLHLFLSAMGCLRGATYFSELRDDADLMEQARRLLVDEATAALLSRHGAALDRNAQMNYCDSILRRTTCPVFHDSVDRGIRGIMRKLRPTERLVYAVRTVAGEGIRPELYARALAAAAAVARREGETEMDLRPLLNEHCGFEPDEEAELIALIVSAYDDLTAETAS